MIAVGIAAAMALPATATAQSLGLGFVIGEPTGLAAIVLLDESAAVDLVVAWAFGGGGGTGDSGGSLHVNADYLLRYPVALDQVPGQLELTFGAGAKILIKTNPELGARLPIGLRYIIDRTPLDIFLEVAPGLLLFPATNIDVSGGLGLRFLF